MKRPYLICLILCLSTTFLLCQSSPVPSINETARVAAQVSASQSDPKAQAKILDSYGKLPLSFEANQGRTDARVKFLSRTAGYTLFLTGDEAVLALRGRKQSSPQRLSPASLAGSNGTAAHLVEQQSFVSVHRFSDAVSSGKSEAPLGAARRDRPGADRTTGAVLRMKLRNANPAARVTGADELAGTSNYFIGNDPARWRSNVPTYAKVKYKGIYPGVDLVYYGNQRQLEYDFIVAPGADPRRIAFDVRGTKGIHRGAHGDLVLKMAECEIRWHKPVVYQEKNGTRREIAAHYAITDKNRVGFEVAKYDASRPLYIDPLIYSTYLGGSGYDVGDSIAVDNAGNAYVTGRTSSTDFPTMNPLQQTYGGGDDDAFVTKINPTGSALVYSTYLGGSGVDVAYGIAVDSAGNAYVTGVTASTDFPTMNPLQPTLGGGADAFVAKINPGGSALVYSTYLGGSGDDWGQGIAVDSAGDAYVTGNTCSSDFPTMNPLQPAYGGGNCAIYVYGDVFVTKISPAGSALVYSTYLGGSGSDIGNGIAVDSAGNAYVTGATASTDFPTMNPLQPVNHGGTYHHDAFVTKFNGTGSPLVYSTYLGGGGDDFGDAIVVDSAGNAYVTGQTYSTDFPTTPSAFQTTCSYSVCSAGEVFVSKINEEGSALVYSTYLGGTGSAGLGIAVDDPGNAYVTGSILSKDFPTTPGAFQTVCKGCGRKGGGSAFVTKFNPAGSALVYSTYFGGSGGGFEGQEGMGIAVDGGGKAYVIGYTSSPHFPTMKPLQPNYGGDTDAFLSKIDLRPATTTTLSSSPNPSTQGQPVTFTAMVTSGAGTPPDGEIVSFMKGKTVLGTGSLSGGLATFTISTLKVGTTVVKAVYGGDSNFAGSTSKAVKQVVN